MAKVLQVLGPSTGGIRRHVAVLARQLPARGWEVDVAGPAGVMSGLGIDQHAVDEHAVHEHTVDIRPSPAAVPGAVRRLRPLVQDATLVHAHGLTAGWVASLVPDCPPLVVTVHNLVLDEAAGRAAPALRWAESRLPRRADRIIAISDEVARRFTGLPGADRIDVVAPVGPEPEPDEARDVTRARLGVTGADPLVVLVGRLHPQKDIGTFLAAAARVRERISSARFAVVGEGPESHALQAQAEQLGLKAALVFTGPRPHAANEMAAADVVVCSSLWESFGLVVAEALQLGRPVAATAVGRIPEMVIDGQTGRLVPPRDAEALAAAIGDLLASPKLAARLAHAGQARVRERFGPQGLVDAVVASYRRSLHADA